MIIEGISSTDQTAKVTAASAKVSNGSSFSEVLSQSTEKTVSLDSIFEKAAKKYNIDVDLLKAIAKQESNFQTDAVSSAGAKGIMQLMPATAKAMGVKDVMDPEDNIMGGAKLISQLLQKYDGDVKLALAGYNAGTGNVAKYGGVPPFKETQNYIKKVMCYYENGVDAPDTSVTVSNDTEASVSSTVSSSRIQTATAVNDGTHPVVTGPDASLLSDDDDIFSYSDYIRFLDILMSLSS